TGHADIAGILSKDAALNMMYGIEFEELGQEDGGKAYTGQATLTSLPVKSARVLRFVHQSTFWQPHDWIPTKWSLMQRRAGGRIALVSELDFEGRLLVVYNVHLESRSTGSIQLLQLEECFADMKRYPEGTSFLLAGDINSG